MAVAVIIIVSTFLFSFPSELKSSSEGIYCNSHGKFYDFTRIFICTTIKKSLRHKGNYITISITTVEVRLIYVFLLCVRNKCFSCIRLLLLISLFVFGITCAEVSQHVDSVDVSLVHLRNDTELFLYIVLVFLSI